MGFELDESRCTEVFCAVRKASGKAVLLYDGIEEKWCPRSCIIGGESLKADPPGDLRAPEEVMRELLIADWWLEREGFGQ